MSQGDASGSEFPSPTPGYASHEVLNQPGSLVGYNAFAEDKALVEAVKVFRADWAYAHLHRVGEIIGSEKLQLLAHQANRHLPELKTHDRFGNRIDLIEFHPTYHELMGLIFQTQTHSFGWTEQRAGAHVARATLSYLWNQGENGVCCPMGMTFASVAALKNDPGIYQQWAPLILTAS